MRDTPRVGPISRRTFLALAATVVAGACSGSDDDASSSATTGSGPDDSTTDPSELDVATSTADDAAPTTDAGSATTATAAEPPTAEYDGTTDPFVLGVASGDPLPDSVVLWTRLIAGDGESLTGERSVKLEISTDDDPSDIRSSWHRTNAESAYTVHAVVSGLDPDRWYTYRFRSGGFASIVGRTRTAPAADASVDQVVIGAASCQHYEDGFYAAHRDVAAAGLDLLIWLGDYIYEGGPGVLGEGGAVRLHDAPEPTTLDEYRARYALYKQDPALQAAHASCPWLVTWDDHEVDNNYAGVAGQDGDDLSLRRATAYRAWWEHTPTRLPPPAATGPFTIYRPQRWGTLLDVSLLDTRQYRSDQTCGDVALRVEPPCLETFLPERTMLGDEQEAWLADRFGRQGTIWNVLAQQVIMSDARLDGAVLNFDQWDGYPVARDRLLSMIAEQAVENVVVLTGDIHFAGVGNLVDPAAPETPATERRTLGAEFVCTSISSGGLIPAAAVDLVRSLPSIVDVELVHRGWTKHIVTPTSWIADHRIVADPADPESPSSTYRRFVVDVGTPGARPEA